MKTINIDKSFEPPNGGSREYEIFWIIGENEKRWSLLHDLFDDGPDEMNLLFRSPRAIHTGGDSLKSIEKNWDKPDSHKTIDLMVFCTRIFMILLFDVKIERKDDIYWLSGIIKESSKFFNEASKSNIVTKAKS